jgi:hypothetical protein
MEFQREKNSLSAKPAMKAFHVDAKRSYQNSGKLGQYGCNNIQITSIKSKPTRRNK